MKLVTIDEIKKSYNVFIFADAVNVSELKEISKDEKNTMILILDDTRSNILKKLSIDNSNITVRRFSWNIFKQKHHYRYLSSIESNKLLPIYLAKQLNSNIKITNFITDLYKDSRIENAFKKQLLQYLKKHSEIKIVMDQILLLNSNIIFLNKNINKPENLNLNLYKSNLHIFYNKIKYLILFLFYPLYGIFFLKPFQKIELGKKIAIRVFKDGFKFKNSDYNLDWIKKNGLISKDKMMFVIEDNIDPEFLNSIKEKKYNYTYASKRKPFGNLTLKNLLHILKLFISSFSKIFYFFNAPIVYQKIILNAWLSYFIWKNFLSLFEPKVYLSYQDYLEKHIFRNILLNKKNCKCIMYKHTNSERAIDIKEKYFNVSFAYDCHDLEIHWTKESIEMSKLNNSQSKKFILSSPLWSSAEFMRNNEIVQSYRTTKTLQNKKIVSAFSSAFGPDSINNIENHLIFLHFLENLLITRDDIILIFKPKYSFSLLNNYSDLKSTLKRLMDNKMFKVVREITSKNLIFISDLTISMPFASSTLEAISSGKKGFWVDANNNFPNSAYKDLNNLVASSNDQALKSTNYWLSMDDLEFKKILKQSFKENIPLNLNNEATERIRSIIINEISDKEN